MIEIIEGNLVDPPLGINVIAHQANINCTFGAGVALAIKKALPQAYEADLEAGRKAQNNLGWFSKAICQRESGQKILVYNLYAQSLKNDSLVGVPTSYDAIISALIKMGEDLKQYDKNKIKIGLPYMMGCALGGGNFEVYSKIVEEFLVKKIDSSVYFVRLPS